MTWRSFLWLLHLHSPFSLSPSPISSIALSKLVVILFHHLFTSLSVMSISIYFYTAKCQEPWSPVLFSTFTPTSSTELEHLKEWCIQITGERMGRQKCMTSHLFLFYHLFKSSIVAKVTLSSSISHWTLALMIPRRPSGGFPAWHCRLA